MYSALADVSIDKITKVDIAETSKSIWIEKNVAAKHICDHIPQ